MATLMTCSSAEACSACHLHPQPNDDGSIANANKGSRGVQRSLKRGFLAFYLVCNLICVMGCLLAIVAGYAPSVVAWIFALGASLPTTLVLSLASAGQLAALFGDDPVQASPMLYLVTLICSMGAIVVSPIYLTSPATVSLVSTLSWWAYDTWYARQDLKHLRSFLTQSGTQIEPFVVQDPHGRDIPNAGLFQLSMSSKMLRTPEHLVIILFRGNWCPVCMAQIDRFKALSDEFTQLNVGIAVVSSQPLIQQQLLARKLEDSNIRVFHDADNQLAKAWGLLSEGAAPVFLRNFPADAAIPATLLVNKDWRLLESWLSRDYRTRASPEQVLAALTKAA
eukprot:TRINITY_DN24027_c0_g1_i1.p1 TRINITY_DN24027_c0_g1~~TRINITY_DN24027_c0_g1_i1.p1  ORF type:complete len:337 (+),score=45.89 TRINITY_DN24027_c0_g1_i1:220-1230(+)